MKSLCYLTILEVGHLMCAHIGLTEIKRRDLRFQSLDLNKADMFDGVSHLS